jgi:hypothetical protein
MAESFRTFDDFWPFYVREHSHPLNRALHFVGTTGVLACLGTALLTRSKVPLLAAPFMGYGLAWIGHFLVEKNRPATFRHPLWSLRADFVMYKKMWTGEMAAELARALESNPASA